MSKKSVLAILVAAILFLFYLPSWGAARKNVALGKKEIQIGCDEQGGFSEKCHKVDNTERGPLELLTDGKWDEPWYIDGVGDPINIPGGRVWIQLDLEAVYNINEIVVYHCPWAACAGRAYHQNKTSVSVTGEFDGKETVVFDSEKDGEYPEPLDDGHHIKLDLPVPGRYVRDEANGNTSSSTR